MEYAVLVVMLALVEYLFFIMKTGKARVDTGVDAPAVSGHPDFERMLRVQQNTMEQLIIFIPAAFIFVRYWDSRIVLALGLIFIVGRFLYFMSYTKDPKKRGPGFGLTFLANVILVLGSLVGAVRVLLG